jgi:hypothetical protein
MCLMRFSGSARMKASAVQPNHDSTHTRSATLSSSSTVNSSTPRTRHATTRDHRTRHLRRRANAKDVGAECRARALAFADAPLQEQVRTPHGHQWQMAGARRYRTVSISARHAVTHVTAARRTTRGRVQWRWATSQRERTRDRRRDRIGRPTGRDMTRTARGTHARTRVVARLASPSSARHAAPEATDT